MVIHAVLLGVLTVTSYRPIPEQTKPECQGRFHCTTATDDGITRYGVAVSQDMLRSGEVRYGDVLMVPGYGFRVVNDSMGPAAVRSIDLMVFTKQEEKAVGVRHLQIFKISGEK